MQKILFISFFLVYSIALHGQNCFGTNLFPYGDFGSGIANIAPAPNWYPQNLLRYVSTPPPEGDNEGEYTITNRVMPIPWGGHAALFWMDTRNSSPDPNGYMMVIDAKNAQGAATPIWREEIELCGSATYEFSVDVINLFNPTLNAPTIYEPNLSIRLNGVVLENYNGGVIPRDGRWHTYRTTINIPDGASNYVLDLFHKSEKDGLKAYGGDFAIDNISLRRCEPTITIPTNINICSSAPFTIDATIINLNFPNPLYQWQQSNDNGLTWQNIAGANTPQLTINAPEPGRQYRLVLAERIALLNFAACQVRSNVTTLNVQTSKSNIQRAICAGRQIEVAGNTFNQAGTYTITTTNRAGCDSMITLNLSILPNVNTVLNQFICNGETFNFFGQALTNAGTYQMTLTAKNGCDSIITLSLNLRPSIEINQTASICEGESYVFEGQTLTQAGTYQAAYKTISGCDSLINLRLSVLQHSSHLRTIELCAGETFEGKIYTANQIVETKLVNAVGCDSLLTTNIIVRPIYENVVNLELCENSIFQGQTITSDVRITNRQLSIFGCDSITHFDIRVLRPVRVELVRQICIGESFTFAGQARQTAGQYTEVLVGSNGCDSVIVLNLEVLQSIEINQTASICEGESYLFGNRQLTNTGVFIDTLPSVNGCDSIITLILNVLQKSFTTINVALCAGETYQGQAFRTDTILTDVLPNAVGCDSIITTIILINPIYAPTVEVALCKGDFFQNQNIQKDTAITITYATINGCDSIVTYQIIVEDLSDFKIKGNTSVCPDETTVLSTGNFASYEWSNGVSTATIEANEVGWYGVTVTSALGCMASDSIFVEATALTARVESNAPRCFSEKNGSIQITNPQGGTAPYQYALNGKIQDIPIFTNLEAGNYNISILDAAGCVLNLEYELTQPDLLQVELGEGATLALGEVIELTPVVNRAVNFKWQPAEVLSCVDCQNPIFVALTTTNVFLEVTDAQGCQAKTNVRFVVDRYRLYAPNVFSPNGDSNNDRFKIFPGSGVAKVDYLKIYDRWGSLIFEQINPDMNALEWDGQSKNQLLSTGNYSWVLSIQLVNGRRELLTGEVLLVN